MAMGEMETLWFSLFFLSLQIIHDRFSLTYGIGEIETLWFSLIMGDFRFLQARHRYRNERRFGQTHRKIPV